VNSSKLSTLYDCAIIGGGPAGLTCAIFLGRYRRSVLVLDSSKPRNHASRGIHGFLGQHSIPPSDLLRRGREEAEAVGVQFVDATVSRVVPSEEGFAIESDAGTARARRVVLAYGVRDKVPDIPRFEEFYGTAIHHCPDCDGYESSDLRIGVIGSGKSAAGLALELLQWSSSIRIFTNGKSAAMTRVEKAKLAAKGIDVHLGKITALQGEEGHLRSVVLDSGEEVAVESLFFTIGVERACVLAEEMGCAVYRGKPNIRVSEHRQTSIRGVYAIGDLTPGAQLAITAAADGAVAAIEINKSLMEPARKV
jgi:thioredoxin reductase